MNSALLVIDVQRGLFDASPRPHEADQVIARINQLSARARSAHVPVVFVQHESPSGLLEHGSASWLLAQNLAVSPHDTLIRKTTPDSFLRTRLGELLLEWEIAQLIICGYASEFCVDTTTRRAAALGYAVVLAADAHTTHDKKHACARQIRAHHNATLPAISSFGPRITACPSTGILF